MHDVRTHRDIQIYSRDTTSPRIQNLVFKSNHETPRAHKFKTSSVFVELPQKLSHLIRAPTLFGVIWQ